MTAISWMPLDSSPVIARLAPSPAKAAKVSSLVTGLWAPFAFVLGASTIPMMSASIIRSTTRSVESGLFGGVSLHLVGLSEQPVEVLDVVEAESEHLVLALVCL